VAEGLSVGSLILAPLGFFPMTFLAFFLERWLVVALCFPSRVLDDLALAPSIESPTDSPLRDRVETGIVGMSMSPSKPGIGEMKLSKTCIQIHQGQILKRRSLN
jgi:hypothetical protein